MTHASGSWSPRDVGVLWVALTLALVVAAALCALGSAAAVMIGRAVE